MRRPRREERCFSAAKRAPFAFAAALRDAVNGLRRASPFDHEFFWAPWTMYGVG